MNVILMSLALLGAAEPPVKTEKTPATYLYVRTTPSGAEILLNGKSWGKADKLVPVKPGRYTIVVDLEGFQAEKETVTVRNGRIRRIEFTLDRNPSSPPSVSPKEPGGAASAPETTDEAAVRKVIAKFAAAAAKGDKGTVAEFLHPRMHHFLDNVKEMPGAVSEGLELAKIRSVMLRGDRALVVNEPGANKSDPEFFDKSIVFTLVRQDGRWLIEDMDLEKKRGVADEILRFREEIRRFREEIRNEAELPAPTEGEPAKDTTNGEAALTEGEPATDPGTLERPPVEEPRKAFELEHPGQVVAVAFSADGKSFATGDGQGMIRVCRAASGQVKTTFPLLNAEQKESLSRLLWRYRLDVEGLAFSPDGKTLAAGNALGVVKLFDVETGKPRLTLQDKEMEKEYRSSRIMKPEMAESMFLLPRAQGSVKSLAFSPDGTRLATGGDHIFKASGITPGTLKIWDAQTGELRHDLVGHLDVWGVALSPDGNMLVSAGGSGLGSRASVRCWSPRSGRQTGPLTLFQEGIRCVAFSPNGKLLAGGGHVYDAKNASHSGLVVVWEARSGSTLWIRPLSQTVSSIAISPDGKTLVTASRGKSVKLWDAVTGESRQEIEPMRSPDGEACCVAFSPADNVLAIGGETVEEKGFVSVWDLGRSAPGPRLRFNIKDGLPESAADTPVAGVVLAMGKEGLVEISIGSDGGLRKGQRLEVYRVGNASPKYVGRIQVVEIRADKSVCRIDQELRQTPVRKGDSVTLKLRAG